MMKQNGFACTMQAKLLAGQKLQGVLTSNEVQGILRMRGWESQYPLFTTINGARLVMLWALHSLATKHAQAALHADTMCTV